MRCLKIQIEIIYDAFQCNRTKEKVKVMPNFKFPNEIGKVLIVAAVLQMIIKIEVRAIMPKR